jgi:hypothetical protein
MYICEIKKALAEGPNKQDCRLQSRLQREILLTWGLASAKMFSRKLLAGEVGALCSAGTASMIREAMQ